MLCRNKKYVLLFATIAQMWFYVQYVSRKYNDPLKVTINKMNEVTDFEETWYWLCGFGCQHIIQCTAIVRETRRKRGLTK